MRQVAAAIDYLVWMPAAVGVSLLVTLFAYGVFSTVLDPFTRNAAPLITGVVLVGWPVWVFVIAWNVGNDSSRWARVLAGLVFVVPTMVVLTVALNDQRL